VLRSAFCPKGKCSVEAADRFVHEGLEAPAVTRPPKLAEPATAG